jgi:ligand-binding sensor domain-containing protein
MRKFALIIAVLCSLAAANCMAQEVKRYFFTHYTTTNGLLSNHVESMAQDEQGYLWIATVNGLQRFDGHSFISFRHDPRNPHSIPDNEVWETRIDKNKNLWLLFANGKAGIFNTRTFKCKEVKIDIANDDVKRSVKKFIIDSKGNVMILVPKLDLVTYNEKTNSFAAKYNVVKTKPHWIPFDMVEDPATGKFYMTADSGMLVYNSRTKLLNYAFDNKENDPVIKTYGHILFPGYPYIDKKRRLWFQNWFMAGAPSFYCYDLDKQEKVIDSLNMGYVLRGYCEPKQLTEQKDGRMFLTGTPILAEYVEAQKKFIPVHNSLMGTLNMEYNVILYSYSDREENMWLCTRNDGLYKFNPSAQLFTSISHTNPFTGLPGASGILAHKSLG